MSLSREPFSWDDEGDQPVPLDDRGLRDEIAEEPVVLQEAEAVVREAQDVIARQDTDPTIMLPEPPSTTREAVADGPSRDIPRRTPRALVVTVALGCLLAFAHGWSVGSSPEANASVDSCDRSHCSEEPGR